MSSNFFLQPLELVAQIVGAKNLVLSNYITSSLYVVVYLDGHLLGKTATVTRSTSPTWGKTIRTTTTFTRGSFILFKLFNGEKLLGYCMVSVNKYFASPSSSLSDEQWHGLRDGSGCMDIRISVNSFPDIPVVQPNAPSPDQWWDSLKPEAMSRSSRQGLPEVRVASQVLKGFPSFHRSQACSLKEEIIKDLSSVLGGTCTDDFSHFSSRLRTVDFMDGADMGPGKCCSMWVVEVNANGPQQLTELSFNNKTDYLRVISGLASRGVRIVSRSNCGYELCVSEVAGGKNVDDRYLVFDKRQLGASIQDSSVGFEARDMIKISNIHQVEIDSHPFRRNSASGVHDAKNLKNVTMSGNLFWFRPPPLGTLGHFKQSRRDVMLSTEEYRIVILISDPCGTTRHYSHGYSTARDMEEHYFHALWQAPLRAASISEAMYGGFKLVIMCEVLLNGNSLSKHTIAEQYVSFQGLFSAEAIYTNSQAAVPRNLVADICLRNQQRVIVLRCQNMLTRLCFSNRMENSGRSYDYHCSVGYQLIAAGYRSDVILICNEEASGGTSASDTALNRFSVRFVEPNDTPLATHVRLLFYVQNLLDLTGDERVEIGFSNVLIQSLTEKSESFQEQSINVHWSKAMEIFCVDSLKTIMDHRFSTIISTSTTKPIAVPFSYLTDMIQTAGGSENKRSRPLFDYSIDDTHATLVHEDPFADSVSEVIFDDNDATSIFNSHDKTLQSGGPEFGTLRMIYELTRDPLQTHALESVVCAPALHASGGVVPTVPLQEIRQHRAGSHLNDNFRKPFVVQSMKPHNCDLFEKQYKTSISRNGVSLSKQEPTADDEKLKFGRISDFLQSDCDDGIEMIYLEVYEVVQVRDISASSRGETGTENGDGLMTLLVDRSGHWQYPVKSLRNDQELSELSSIYSFHSEWIVVPEDFLDYEDHYTTSNRSYVVADRMSKSISTKLVNDVLNMGPGGVGSSRSTTGQWLYGTSISALSDPLLRCSILLPGCRYKRRKWIRYLEKYTLPMALFSDLHESIRDIMPPTRPFSGPYVYSGLHKPHEKAESTPSGGEFAPPFLSLSQKTRFGSMKDRKSSFQQSLSMKSMSFRTLDHSFTNDIDGSDANLSKEEAVGVPSVIHSQYVSGSDVDLVTQTSFDGVDLRGSKPTDNTLLLPLHTIVDYRVVLPTVFFVSCKISLQLFAALRREWDNMQCFYDRRFDYDDNECADYDADENDDSDAFTIELYLSCANAFEMFEYFALLLHTQHTHTALVQVMPALNSFKRRVSDRGRMILMTSSHAEMEQDRKIIWTLLSDIRSCIRNTYMHTSVVLRPLPTGHWGPVFDLKRYMADTWIDLIVPNTHLPEFIAEVSSSNSFELNATSMLIISLLEAYHTLVVTQALNEPQRYRVMEICVAEESPGHMLSELVNISDSDTVNSSRQNSEKMLYALNEDSEHTSIAATESVDASAHREGLQVPSALEIPDQPSMVKKRSAVRYSYTPTAPNPTPANSMNAPSAHPVELVNLKDLKECQEGKGASVVAPDLFTIHQKILPPGVSGTVQSVVSFASFMLEETETRILLCSAVPRAYDGNIGSWSLRDSEAQSVENLSELCVVINMLVTRCIRQIVLVVAEHLRRAALRPVEYIPAGASSVISYLDRSDLLASISGLDAPSFPRRSTSRHTNQVDREFNLRFKPGYSGAVLGNDKFLPLTSYLLRGNGRLALTVDSICANNNICVNRSALLAFFVDYKSIMKWELRPRAEAAYSWCMKFCSFNLSKYLEVKMRFSAYLEKQRGNVAEEKILSAPEDFALMLNDYLFSGAYDVFLKDIEGSPSIFTPEGSAVDNTNICESNPRADDEIFNSALLKQGSSKLRFSRSAILLRHSSEHRQAIPSCTTIASNASEGDAPTKVRADSVHDCVLVDTHYLRNISFLNDIRQVCSRSLEMLLNHYSEGSPEFSRSTLSEYRSGHPGTDNSNPMRHLSDLRRDFVLACGFSNDCIDFSILTEECTEAICKVTQHTQRATQHVDRRRGTASTSAEVTNDSGTYSTAQLQSRGRVISMRRAEQDYGIKFGVIGDKFARLAVSAIGTCCKELLKSAEVVSTSWGARSTSDFCTASEILSFAEVFLPEIANNLMSGLYSFFLKLFLEQITELIMKYVALDMDGNEYFYLEHVADIGNPTAFVNSKRKLLTEMRSVRSFFYTAIKGKDWSSDFMSISRCNVVDKRRESNCNSDQFRVTDLDRSSNSQRVAKSDPLLNKSVGTDQNAGTQVKPGISFSRADASNMQRQVQNLHGAIEASNFTTTVLPEERVESNCKVIDEQWRLIKEVHPELGSLLYTLEKRLEVDNRRGYSGEDEDVPSVCDIAGVIRSVSPIDVDDCTIDAFSVLSLPSYRPSLDRRFYSSPLVESPKLTVKVAELSILRFKHRLYTLETPRPIETNAEIWCLSRGKTVHRSVTQTRINDRFPYWKDVLEYTYQSSKCSEIVDELVVILCDYSASAAKNTHRDVPMGYGRVPIGAIDICPDISEVTDILPLLLTEDEWIKITTSEVLPKEIISTSRCGVGTAQTYPEEDSIGEMHVSIKSWSSR